MENVTARLFWNVITLITGISSPKISTSKLCVNPTMQLWSESVEVDTMAKVFLLSLSCVALTCSGPAALIKLFHVLLYSAFRT